ncbi:MAG TPA: exosome complex protein Rrp42 [Thermoplasmata archaeon]|nr:exosome complex protein Rrp42 [Thermoplasmata archaeon]
MNDDIIFEIKKDFMEKLVKQGKRIDNRELDEFRPIKVEINPVSVAEGSAKVSIGDTTVLVGIKADVGTPYPDRPEDGVLITNAELIPMASPDFEAGPPDQNAIELARVVDRGVRESGMLNTKALCLTPNEKVFLLFADIHVLDYCGNLFDASSLATVLALKNAVISSDRFEELEEDFPIETVETPVSVTFVKIADVILVDPSLEEEKVAQARLTVTTDSQGNIRAMQKGFKGRFTVKEIDEIVEQAIKKGNEIRRQFLS